MLRNEKMGSSDACSMLLSLDEVMNCAEMYIRTKNLLKSLKELNACCLITFHCVKRNASAPSLSMNDTVKLCDCYRKLPKLALMHEQDGTPRYMH